MGKSRLFEFPTEKYRLMDRPKKTMKENEEELQASKKMEVEWVYVRQHGFLKAESQHC